MSWYYVDGAGQQAGPLDDAGLEAMTANGGITSETLVWREGMANWLPLREVKGGAASSQAPPMVATGVEEAVCSQCGGMFPVQDTIRVGSARVCANCKPVFVQKMREGVSVEQAGALRFAGFWVRFGAYFLDGIILGIVSMAINLAFGFGMAGFGGQNNLGAGFSLLSIGVIILKLFTGLSYETFMIGKYGATLGKMACKIQVVTPEGFKVTYGRAAGRYFAKIVSSFTCLIGFIMAGFDSEKRALHDRMCNTRVVFK